MMLAHEDVPPVMFPKEYLAQIAWSPAKGYGAVLQSVWSPYTNSKKVNWSVSLEALFNQE